ncbi:MAG TPA: hypothetical protein VK249_23115 [Anaerolineales bacterium]|nr:hypothetical protein [Anaerolineales bacterium]
MTSSSYRNVGLIQFLLASVFVIWLVFLPGLAGKFAWPITNRLSAMFIGTCFALRAFEGYFMWREANWLRLRWLSWGTMAFLTFIFAATYWHIDLMNWKPFNLMTVIWLIAYTGEPLTIPFVEPRGAELDGRIANGQGTGAISSAMQNLLLAIMFIAAALCAMLFINPMKFIANIWPWQLTAFDARIMSSFFGGIVFWAAKMKFAVDWVEIRMGIQGFILFFGGHFLVWLFNLVTGQLNTTVSAWIYGAVTGALAIVLIIFYWQHERK